MPATYRVYEKSSITDDESTAVQVALVFVGHAAGNDAKQALRAWFGIDGNRASKPGATFVLIPASSHHELTPSVETQTRLSFS